MYLCECGTYTEEKAEFCCNCGKPIKKDIYSVQLAWKLIAFSIAAGGIGYAFEIIILILLAIPVFFIGIVRIGLEIEFNSSHSGQHTSTIAVEESKSTEKSLDEISESELLPKALNHLSEVLTDATIRVEKSNNRVGYSKKIIKYNSQDGLIKKSEQKPIQSKKKQDINYKKNKDAFKEKLDAFSVENLLEELKSGWIEDLWRWADKHRINEYDIPRNKIDLLNIECLSIKASITELPIEICKLSKLKNLTISFLSLTKLPKEIGNLKDLNELNLWVNNLTELPKEIGLLTNLIELDISENPIKILPDEITNLINLKKFDFDYENIEFSELQYDWLFELNSNGCELPSEFFDSCKKFSVTEQQINEPPPWVDEVPPCDEAPPWINGKLFYDEIPPWMVDNESKAIKESFEKFGVTSLWHMTHVDNIKNILKRGILCNIQAYNNARPVDISDHGVQKRRAKTDPIYRRNLHDYTPTYLNIKNPMLFVKGDLQNTICLIELSLSILSEKSFLFTDGNAAAKITKFYNSVNDLERLPWDVLNAEYWNDFEDGKRKRCAEVLVYQNIPPKYIIKIYCNSHETLKQLSSLPVQSAISEELFFNNHQAVNGHLEDDIPF